MEYGLIGKILLEKLQCALYVQEGRVKDYINGLYDFLVQNEVQKKLAWDLEPAPAQTPLKTLEEAGPLPTAV